MEIPINQDIRKYKIRDIGPFTLKEAGWIVVAGVCAYGCYIAQKAFFPVTETTYFVSMLATVPALAFGFFKPYGVTFLTFLRMIMKENFASPQFRPYESSVKYVLTDFLPEKEAENVWRNWTSKHRKIKKRKGVYK